MSDQRYDASATVAVATTAAPVVGRSPRVGYVPVRANMVRDGVAVALLVISLLLPWNLDFGLGVPGSNGSLFARRHGRHAARHPRRAHAARRPVPAHRPRPDVRRTSRVRLLLGLAYFVVAIGFVGYQLLQTWRNGGTGLVPPGDRARPAPRHRGRGARRRSRRSRVSRIEDNGFRRWYAVARLLGVLSIALATLSVAFNVYWRLRYLFVTNEAFGSQDFAVIVTTLLYGAAAMIALVIASRWLTEKTAAARLATTALGASGAVAATLVWILPIGRDIDAFHGIAENTSTAAVGYEGYLFWAAAAAIVAPTTLYAVFLIKPPTLGAYRSAAEKCLTLIAFWAFAAAALRVIDFLIAWTLDLPNALYDTVAMTAFNVITGVIARWLHRQLVRGEASPARHRGVQRAAVRLHRREPRHRRRARAAIRRSRRRRDLRQQPGPADHQHVRRGHLRAELRRAGRHAVHRAAGRLLHPPPSQGRGADISPGASCTRRRAWAVGLRATDTRAAFATRFAAENRSAERGFDDGDPGACDGGDRRADCCPAYPASRTGIRADDRAAHTAAGGHRRVDTGVV